MYTSTFTFAKRQSDDEFHTLDKVIAQVSESTRLPCSTNADITIVVLGAFLVLAKRGQ